MLKKKFKYVLLFLCIYYFTPINYCNKNLKPYVKEVLEITNKYCTKKQYYNPLHTYIYFKKLPNNIIGYCSSKINGYGITIDPIYWKYATEADRFQLVVHEMSHCIIGKNHVDNKFNYMYYSLYPLSKQIVTQQFIENLRSVCGR